MNLPAVWLPFIAVLGLIFGSFVTALSYRLPRGHSIADGRSKCPACGTALGVGDLFPVLSWAWNRGRCRHCGADVSWRYPAIELMVAALCLGAALVAESPAHLAVLLISAPLAVCIGVVDIEHRRIPNALIVALAAVMGSWRVLSGAGAADVAAAIVIAVAVLITLLALNWAVQSFSGAELLGPADSKLLAAVAVGFVPWQLVIFLGLVGLVATVFGLVWQAASRRPEFPLGPSFAAAFMICLADPGLSVRFGL